MPNKEFQVRKIIIFSNLITYVNGTLLPAYLFYQ